MPLATFNTYSGILFAGTAHLDVQPEPENQEYEAGLVTVDGGRWRTRTAKITPTKPGAFVSVWRRAADGTTEPFPNTGAVQGLLVFVMDQDHKGVFRFTQEHLTELGVTRTGAHPGKRGFRVYPSWCGELNRQAQRTQQAQARAFQLL